MIRGTSSGADDVIGNGKCVLSGHLREAIWMIASNKNKTDQLARIQKRAVKIIDRARHKDLSYNELLNMYDIEDLGVRRKKHHLSVMFRQSHDTNNLDSYRPETNLRSNLKIRFKNKITRLTKVQRSPYYRGITLWDRLPVAVQKATTKVKFKCDLSRYIPA